MRCSEDVGQALVICGIKAKRPGEQGGSLMSVLAVGRRPKPTPGGARHKYSSIF